MCIGSVAAQVAVSDTGWENRREADAHPEDAGAAGRPGGRRDGAGAVPRDGGRFVRHSLRRADRSASTEIAGGYFPDPNAWPWVTSLVDPTRTASSGDFGRQFCTAVLISPTRVLTAAHCVVAADNVTPDPPNKIQVLVGRRDLTQANQGERRNVTGVAVHPKLSLPQAGIHKNHAFYDIAVLFLESPITTIPPAPIGLSTDWNTWATAMGFGHSNYDHNNPVYDQYLRAADFDLLTDGQCAAAFDTATVQHFYPEIHVCADNAPTAPVVDCITHGDSGGPLMIRRADGSWHLIGITSFYPHGVGRCSAGGPFGFAWVAGPAMRDWPLTVTPPATTDPTTTTTTSTTTTTTTASIGSPGTVRKLTLKHRRSSPKFTIDWRPPTTDGGAAIVRYDVQVYHRKKRLIRTSVRGSTSKVKLRTSKLRRGKNKVYVRAFNGTAYSPWSVLVVRRS